MGEYPLHIAIPNGNRLASSPLRFFFLLLLDFDTNRFPLQKALNSPSWKKSKIKTQDYIFSKMAPSEELATINLARCYLKALVELRRVSGGWCGLSPSIQEIYCCQCHPPKLRPMLPRSFSLKATQGGGRSPVGTDRLVLLRRVHFVTRWLAPVNGAGQRLPFSCVTAHAPSIYLCTAS